MAQIACGVRREIDGPPICAEYLTEAQLAELQELQPTLSRIRAHVWRRRQRRKAFIVRASIGPRGHRAVYHALIRQQGRERRPSCNQRSRGSRRSRAGPDDSDPPGDLGPQAWRGTAGVTP
jgi:hypothetical protein